MDPQVLDRIVDTLPAGTDVAVIEVGAGHGVLTERLAPRFPLVAALEIDPQLCDILRDRFRGRPTVRIVCGDVLAKDPATLLAEAGSQPPYAVIGNLPYYITGLVLRHFLEAASRPRWLVLMLQREVAQSLCSRPPRMSLLAASVRYHGEPEMLFTVPPAAFYPPPEVFSAVVCITVHESPPVEVELKEAFFEVLHAGFSSRRKQLHNALSRGLGMKLETVHALLEQAGIDGTRRAQTLELEEWAALARSLRLHRSGVMP